MADLPAGWVPRSEWGARPPKSNPGPMRSFKGFVQHYTGGSKNGPSDHANCPQYIRNVQISHQSLSSQSDIMYQAVVCWHGVIYEGRVWGYKGGANGTFDSNADYFSVLALVGVPGNPPPEVYLGMGKCYQDVLAVHGNPEAVQFLGHKEIVATSCPGDSIWNWLITNRPNWPKDFYPKPVPVYNCSWTATDETSWFDVARRHDGLVGWNAVVEARGLEIQAANTGVTLTPGAKIAIPVKKAV